MLTNDKWPVKSVTKLISSHYKVTLQSGLFKCMTELCDKCTAVPWNLSLLWRSLIWFYLLSSAHQLSIKHWQHLLWLIISLKINLGSRIFILSHLLWGGNEREMHVPAEVTCWLSWWTPWPHSLMARVSYSPSP